MAVEAHAHDTPGETITALVEQRIITEDDIKVGHTSNSDDSTAE